MNDKIKDYMSSTQGMDYPSSPYQSGSGATENISTMPPPENLSVHY